MGQRAHHGRCAGPAGAGCRTPAGARPGCRRDLRAVLAPLAGVVTLGDFIINASIYGDDGRLAGAILVALLALSLEGLLALLQRRLTSDGLKVKTA